MRLLFRRALAVALSVSALGISSPTTVTAKPIDVAEAQMLFAEDSNLTVAEEASFRAMDRYVDFEHARFDYRAAQSDPDVDSGVLNEFSGTLLAQGWNVDADESDLAILEREADAIEPAIQFYDACLGRNGFQKLPPGILLNSCAASALQNAYAAGAGVAALAALITAETGVGGFLAGAIAGGLAAESGILGICGSWNRGIRLFPGGICWSQ